MNDSAKQQTKVNEIREIIADVHSRSIDIRDKTFELATLPQLKKETEVDEEVGTENVGSELIRSLKEIRDVLRLAHETLSAFV